MYNGSTIKKNNIKSSALEGNNINLSMTIGFG